MNEPKKPWLSSYGVVPHTLTYPEGTMWEALQRTVNKYPKLIAYEFMGTKRNYFSFFHEIEQCAKALKALGINVGDKVTVALPNCPQGIVMFYAINMIGAVANMIHPLSSEGEIAFYLNDSESVAAITLDQFYAKFANIRAKANIKNLIITSIADALSPIMKLGYAVTEGKKVPALPIDAPIVWWKDFLNGAQSVNGEFCVHADKDTPAAILYSGGTTGTTKGIILSNLNFNALAGQLVAHSNVLEVGNSMLAVMPIFHGFGLGVCIHGMISSGCRAILLPRLVLKDYAKSLKKKKPNYIAGVPTLFEALLRLDDMDGTDLSCLRGVFSGGDSLSIELKKKVDAFLKAHGATIQVREGYGTTECVTASCITPYNKSKEGSIGIPMPDMIYKIVKVGTTDEIPYGEEGEICLTGPTMMLSYANQPEETANTMRVHPADGLTWVHTGDLGIMDDEGFLFFKQRIKRMIVSSGYNIYPSQLENIIDSHDLVLMSCCIGVPDPYKIQKVKAFIMLRPGVPQSDETKKTILEHCKKNIAKYAMPYDIEFRDELPKTLVGKVAYRILEEEEAQQRAKAAN